MKYFAVLSMFFIGSGFALVAHAQFGNVEPLSIIISPDYPRPFQVITVTPESNLIDLSASTIVFSVNGQVVQRGSGKESASVAVGGPGQTTTITVTATNKGQTYTARTTIRPADVSLITEPQTTTHPFYEGGALIASEGGLRIIAVPDLRTAAGAPIAASNLVYTWKNGDQILQSASGIGKNVLVGVAPVRFRDTVISVTVASQDTSVVGFARTLVSPVDPQTVIYRNDPLLGPRYEAALSSTDTINTGEQSYRAVPYYFGTIPTLTWSVNGSASQTGSDITVRPAGSGQGRALLGVTALATSPRQTSSSQLSVLFGAVRSGLFGL